MRTVKELVLILALALLPADGFLPLSSQPRQQLSPLSLIDGPPSASMAMEDGMILRNYAPAAASLFANMLTPASILAAGMISIGLKKAPEPPDCVLGETDTVEHIEMLKRVYVTGKSCHVFRVTDSLPHLSHHCLKICIILSNNYFQSLWYLFVRNY